jgi:hypothetical protein
MQVAVAEIKKLREENTAALKPSLSNPNAKAELDELDSRCFLSVVKVIAADAVTCRETQRNDSAKSKALEHKKRVLLALNHSAQTYAAELNARWRSLTNLYDTMILVQLRNCLYLNCRLCDACPAD